MSGYLPPNTRYALGAQQNSRRGYGSGSDLLPYNAPASNYGSSQSFRPGPDSGRDYYAGGSTGSPVYGGRTVSSVTAGGGGGGYISDAGLPLNEQSFGSGSYYLSGGGGAMSSAGVATGGLDYLSAQAIPQTVVYTTAPQAALSAAPGGSLFQMAAPQQVPAQVVLLPSPQQQYAIPPGAVVVGQQVVDPRSLPLPPPAYRERQSDWRYGRQDFSRFDGQNRQSGFGNRDRFQRPGRDSERFGKRKFNSEGAGASTAAAAATTTAAASADKAIKPQKKKKDAAEPVGTEGAGAQQSKKQKGAENSNKEQEKAPDGAETKEKGKKKKNKKAVKPVDDGTLAGFVFCCSNRTKDEVFKRRLFGAPAKSLDIVEQITPGLSLFCYNFDDKELYGVFTAKSAGKAGIIPEAFKTFGDFPVQVRFKVQKRYKPLTRDQLREVIKENFISRNKFRFNLTRTQVEKLIAAFQSESGETPKPAAPVAAAADAEIQNEAEEEEEEQDKGEEEEEEEDQAEETVKEEKGVPEEGKGDDAAKENGEAETESVADADGEAKKVDEQKETDATEKAAAAEAGQEIAGE
eukprot:TRINITY_DN734_c0_g1_i1.p1 TRINITY_DN734_c0_g1~~TRINITY_DN734_c0_g1_i1.p1  ORF type:complete len:575 (-),score=196.42 TRINITY_DN734_c0_g1_i1:303-2027(-)